MRLVKSALPAVDLEACGSRIRAVGRLVGVRVLEDPVAQGISLCRVQVLLIQRDLGPIDGRNEEERKGAK